MPASRFSRRNVEFATPLWRVKTASARRCSAWSAVRPAAFQYSADHKKLGVTWDAATLDKYLTNPRAMVPDTTMVYAGLKDDAKRADLIAYLETLH